MEPTSVAREQLDEAVAHGPEHLRPIARAVRDGGVLFASIVQHAGPFDLRADRPVIAILGDDMDEAIGPLAFDAASVARFVATCSIAVVVACDAQPRFYAAAANAAVLLRANAVIVETRSEHEGDWLDAIRSISPKIFLVAGTVRPETESRH